MPMFEAKVSSETYYSLNAVDSEQAKDFALEMFKEDNNEDMFDFIFVTDVKEVN